MTIKLPRSHDWSLEDKIKRTMQDVFAAKPTMFISFESIFRWWRWWSKTQPGFGSGNMQKNQNWKTCWVSTGADLLSLTAKFPNLLITVEKAQKEKKDVIWAALSPLDAAVANFVAMRSVGRENLKQDILKKANTFAKLVEEVKVYAPQVVSGISGEKKLNNRLERTAGQCRCRP